MVSSLGRDLRAQLAQYVAGDIPLAAFWDWFMPQTLDLDQDLDPVTAELAAAVQLLLFEVSDQLWTESQLRSHLRALVSDGTTVLPFISMTVAPDVATASSATTITGLVLALRSDAAAPHAMVSVSP